MNDTFRFTEEALKWLLLSFAFTSAAIFFSYWIFPSQASILSISFLVVAMTPLLSQLMEREEEVIAHRVKPFLERYDDILGALITMSVGIFLAFSLWYAILPSDPLYAGNRCFTDPSYNRNNDLISPPCKEAVFSLQSDVLNLEDSDGGIAAGRELGTVVGLMLFCFLLSLFLGAGAVLIIAWDVSLLVVDATQGIAAFLAYMPQLFAFFLAGLAGAILSFAIIRHEWRSHAFFFVVRDSLVLLMISVLLIPVSTFLFSLI